MTIQESVFQLLDGWRLERANYNPKVIILSGNGRKMSYELGNSDYRFFLKLIESLEQGLTFAKIIEAAVSNRTKSRLELTLPEGTIDCMLSSAALLEGSTHLMDQREGAALRNYAEKIRDQQKYAVDLDWVAKLRAELQQGAMKDKYWLSRDQCLYLLGDYHFYDRLPMTKATVEMTVAAPTNPSPTVRMTVGGVPMENKVIVSNYDVAVFGKIDGEYYSCRRLIDDEGECHSIAPTDPPHEGEFSSVYRWMSQAGGFWEWVSDHTNIADARLEAIRLAGTEQFAQP